MKPTDIHITGVVLAGGRARRMGGVDKGLVEVAGRPMIEHVLERLGPQVDDVVINANRNRARYLRYGAAVVGDGYPDYQGPLAGMLSAMLHAGQGMIATVPCDSPLVPADLVVRLHRATHQGAPIAVAHDGERLQPVFSLIHVDLGQDLRAFLEDGERKIDRWFARHPYATADFSDVPDTFLNINTIEDRDALQSRI